MHIRPLSIPCGAFSFAKKNLWNAALSAIYDPPARPGFAIFRIRLRTNILKFRNQSGPRRSPALASPGVAYGDSLGPPPLSPALQAGERPERAGALARDPLSFPLACGSSPAAVAAGRRAAYAGRKWSRGAARPRLISIPGNRFDFSSIEKIDWQDVRAKNRHLSGIMCIGYPSIFKVSLWVTHGNSP